MNKFYCVEDGQTNGPFSLEELKGKGLKSIDLVCPEGGNEWIRIDSVEGWRDVSAQVPERNYALPKDDLVMEQVGHEDSASTGIHAIPSSTDEADHSASEKTLDLKNTVDEVDPGHSEKTGTADRLDAVSEDQTDLRSMLVERPAHEAESEDAHGESEDAEGDDNEVEGMQDATVVSPKMFQNVFSSSGRIRRTEYGLTLIIRYVLSWMLGYVVGAAGLSDGATTGLGWLFVISVPLWIWVLSQGAKRCHDLGNSGWYQIIPFYGLWMLFASGDDGSNEYGPSPK